MRVFKDVGLVEQLGSGMSRILKVYDKSIFKISDRFIKVDFPFSVRKDMWGKGVGSMLMEQIIDFAKNVAKVDIIALQVRSDNERAIHLYEKFGFEKFGTFKGYLKIRGEHIDFDFMNLYL